MNLQTIKKTDIIAFLLVLSCQATDLTIGPLKLWEVFSVFLLFTISTKVEKNILPYFYLFTYFLLSSLFVTYVNTVGYTYFSFLKSKYMITVIRYIELVLCLVITMLPFNLFKMYGLEPLVFLRRFLSLNFLFTSFMLMIYLLERVAAVNVFSYGEDYRLRGLYVEGGPFGLYMAFLFLLELFAFRRYIYLVVYLAALIFSISKAGIAMVGVGFFVWVFLRFKQTKSFLKPKNKLRFLLFIVSGVACAGFVLNSIARNYIDDIVNIESKISSRVDDPSFVMGRVAATYIGVNIAANNPLMGVGLGNYSLVRNNDIYRGSFPIVDEWDLTGLGGIITLFLENGLVGVGLFFIVLVVNLRVKLNSVCYALVFIMPFIFGAQLYMLYPWVGLGFYIAINSRDEMII